MSDDNKSDSADTPANKNAKNDPGSEQHSPGSDSSGPKFTQGSDPLASARKGASDAMASMEGKTVSMKTYVGTIIGVIVLMMLARCS